MTPQDLVEWHVRRFKQLKKDRANFDVMFQEIAEVTYPAHANFIYTPTGGEKRMQKVYDSAAIHANELLSSGLFSLLTSSASKWMELRPVNSQLYNIRAVKEHLDDISRIMYHEINRPSAGFNTAMHENYLGYGAFGNLTNFVEEMPEKDSLLFTALPLYECYWVQNQYGIVDTLYRKYTRTVEQLVRKFGKESLSDATKKLVKENKLNALISCFHLICPRETANMLSMKAVDKPFASLYIEEKEAHILREGGYDELPFMAARFYKESFETYGRGPGATTLPDVKMLMRVAQVTIRAMQKSTDPPVMLPDAGFLKPFRTTPGGLNYYRKGRVNIKNDIDVIPTGNAMLGLEYSESLHSRIREAFFVDQLQLTQGPQMTATEVLQRTEEKLRLMGPLLGRIQTELLGPMIIRIHGLLKRAGKFPEPPAELAEEEVKIIYTSPIARAQEQVEANGLMRALGVLEPLMKYDPESGMMDVVNTDEIAKGVFEMFSVRPKFLNDDTKIKQIRKAKADALRKKEEAENLRAMGQGADSIARAGATAQEAGMLPDEGFGVLQ